VLKIILALAVILVFNASAYAKKYNFNDILDQSVNNSFQLKAADYNIKLRAQISKEVRSEYFPTLSVVYDNQYTKNLKDETGQNQIVGDTLISSNTLYKNVLRFRAQYNLFDFGVRGKKYAMSKSDIEKEAAIYKRMRRELSEQIIGLYSEIISAYKEKQCYTVLIALYEELFTTKERLFVAGQSSKLNVMDEAVNIARAEDRIKLANIRMKQALDKLSGFTYEEYDANSFEPDDFGGFFVDAANTDEAHALILDYTPENKIYQVDLTNKARELSIKRREVLPKVSVYSDYYFYGSDRTGMFKAVSDLTQSSFGAGFSINMPLFDGFKNMAQRKRMKLELEKIECEKQHVLHELMAQYNSIKSEWQGYRTEYEIQQKTLGLFREKFDMIKRLDQEQLIGKEEYLSTEADFVKQKLETELSYIKYVSASIKLDIFEDNCLERI